MGGLGHITGLARQQQEHTHRLAIGFGRNAGAIALRGVGLDADADRGQGTEIAPTPSKRDGVVDRAAAGIQHDGGAVEDASAREFIEILRAVGGHDADRADPAPAIRLARDPVELHRLFAFFEGDTGLRRTAGYGDRAGHCETDGGGANQHPTAKI